MRLLRTDDARFAALHGWPYAPRYVDVKGARVHYVDEGRGRPVVLLHGEPTWSYLYRRMIPPLAARHRVVAPDFLGFGRSDKPAEVEDHSVRLHVETLLAFLDALDLRDATLVGQDWGGIIGLCALPDARHRIERVVVMNTGLPDGTMEMPEAWHAFREFMERVPDAPIGKLVSYGCLEALAKEARAAYDAPFPDVAHKAGPRAFPRILPLAPDAAGAPLARRAQELLRAWDKPFLIAFSDGDPITAPAADWFDALVQSPRKERVLIEGAGHFLQEDRGEAVAEAILAFLDRHAGNA